MMFENQVSMKPKTRVLALVPFLCACAFLFSCRHDAIPEEELASYVSAKGLYLSGDYAGALKLLSGEKSSAKGGHRTLLLRARCHFMRGEPGEARKILADLTGRMPEHAEARIWLIRSSLALGRLDDAERELEEALEFNGEDPRLLQLMGEVSDARGNGRNAMDYYSRAASFCDELARVELSLSLIYGRYGQRERALFHLGRSRAFLSPESVLSRPLSELEERLRKEVVE